MQRKIKNGRDKRRQDFDQCAIVNIEEMPCRVNWELGGKRLLHRKCAQYIFVPSFA